MDLLQILSLGLAGYGGFGLATGRVYAKDGMSSRLIEKAEQPGYFLIVCLCYIGVGILLFFAAGQRGA
jgi:hypothetical protein